MSKIISFSLWGDNPKYLQGALENVKLQRQFYKDWTCRFYIHETVPSWLYHRLKNDGCEVIEKCGPLGEHMNKLGMFWRFEALKDKTIDRFIVRDADSRLSQREKNCVIDWEKTGKEFHIIRDHPYHSTLIMGGMWGATRSLIEKINYDDLVNQFNKLQYTNTYASDQEFLARMIYPLIKNNACIHDDLDRYSEGARKIPHFNFDNHYIGESYEYLH